VSVRFYMDEHVSRSITVGLRRRGLDVLTVQEDGRSGAADEVLFSQDDDLLVEANRWCSEWCSRGASTTSATVPV